MGLTHSFNSYLKLRYVQVTISAVIAQRHCSSGSPVPPERKIIISACKIESEIDPGPMLNYYNIL